MARQTIYERAEEYTDLLGRKRKKITLKSGRDISFHDAISGVESGFTTISTWMSRVNKLVSSENEWEQERVDNLVDRFLDMANAMKHARKKREEWERRKARIAAMRNTSGRPPEEAEAFIERAKQEERELQREMRRYGF